MITYINHMSYLYAEIRVALIGILINEPQEFLESFKMLTFEDEKQTEKHKTDIKYFEQWLRNY